MEHVIKKMYLGFSGQMYNDLCISNTERNLQIAWRVDLKLLYVRSFLSQVGLWFLNMVEYWGMTILVETNHDPLVSGILKDDSIQLAHMCLVCISQNKKPSGNLTYQSPFLQDPILPCWDICNNLNKYHVSRDTLWLCQNSY